MKRTGWAAVIPAMNRRMLVGLGLACGIAAIDIGRRPRLTDVPMAFFFALVFAMIGVVLRWRADPAGGHAAERRELIRQGTMLVIEAIRMEGECLKLEGRDADAATAFARALELAATLPADARGTTSAPQAARGLADVIGPERAKIVEQRIAAREAGRPGQPA